MAYLFIALYFLVEGFAFWLVSYFLGVGWALVALGLTFLVGAGLASYALRRNSQLADVGLVMAGAGLVAVPGFVTSLFGLLLIVGPTRRVVKRYIKRKTREGLEAFGAQLAAAAHRPQSYGTFTTPPDRPGPAPQRSQDHRIIDHDTQEESRGDER